MRYIINFPSCHEVWLRVKGNFLDVVYNMVVVRNIHAFVCERKFNENWV